MRVKSFCLSALVGAVAALSAVVATPASANAEFDYTFQQTSGPDTVTGTLTLVMVGGTNLSDLGVPVQGNIPLSDIVSFEFILNGIIFDVATTGKNIVALQFNNNSGALRDITFSGTSSPSGAFLTSTSVFEFLTKGGRVFDIGNFNFVSSEVVPVPEPNSLWLLLTGIGILAFGFFVRLRKRATAAAA
jgi:hypothetical protein